MLSSLLLLLALPATATPLGYGLGVDPWRPNAVPDLSLDVQRDALPFDRFEPGRLMDSDGCPVRLRVSDCTDDTFWQTTCGAKALVSAALPEACRASFELYTAGANDVLQTVDVADPRTGESVEVQFADASPRDVRWSGLDASYAPYLLQLTHPRNGAEAFLAALELVWWQDNCSVQSCAELSFEAYRDYSTFEVAIAQDLRDQDYRAVFERAYSADGIARKTLYSQSREPLPRLTLERGRHTYLSAFQNTGRGPLYGFEPGASPQLEWLDWQAGAGPSHPQLAVPYLLHALGVLPAQAIDSNDVVDTDVALDFLDNCDWDALSGLLTCTDDATVLSQDMAAAMNERLWLFDVATVASIPPDSEWPQPNANPWDMHQDASERLAAAAVPDHTLLWLEDRQQEFGELQSRRASLYGDLFGQASVMSIPPVDRCRGTLQIPFQCDADPTVEVPQLLAALVEVDQRLAALVSIFETKGCFGEAPTACDWSPRWFATAVTDHYVGEREDLFRECTARTGDDFRALRAEPGDVEPFWLVSEEADFQDANFPGICETTDTRQPGPRCEVRSDYLQDDATVRAYFDTLDAWGDAFTERWSFPVDPDTGRPTLGGRVGDAADFGDSNFGITLSYDAGWTFPNLANLPQDMTASAYGQLQVNTRLFGQAIPVVWAGQESEIVDPGNATTTFVERRETGNLVFADLYASNSGTGTDAWAVFDLLGTELYRNVGGTRNANSEGPLSFHYVAQPEPFERVERLGGVQSTVFVGPVPLNLSAGLAGTVGLTATTELRATGGSEATGGQITANAEFRPFARASVFAQASVGVESLVAGGINADLALIEVGLPVTTDVSAVWDPNNADTSLSVDVDASLDMILLQGRVNGFVQLPWKTYSQNLFRYGGIRSEVPLASTHFDADLLIVQRALGIRSGDAPIQRRDAPVMTRLVEDRPGECDDDAIPSPDLYVDFDDENVSGLVLAAELGDATFDVALGTVGLLGQHGQAVNTRGNSVSASQASDLPSSASQTLSMWFRLDDNSPGTLFAQGTADSETGGIVARTADGSRVQFVVPCDTGPRIMTTTWAGENFWHHLFFSRNDNTRQVIAFVDGRPANTLSGCRLDPVGDDLHLGALVRPNSVANTWRGTLDELGIWDGIALDTHDALELLARGDAGLPLAGSGSAPLTSIRDVSGSLVSSNSGTDVRLTWTNPPSLSEPGSGYDSVIVRVDDDGFPSLPDAGDNGYSGTATGINLSVDPGTARLYVSTWATGPAGTGVGDRTIVTADSASLPVVSDLTAFPQDGGTRLSWTLPTDPAVTRVVIARSDRALSAPEDGAVVFNRRGTFVQLDGLANGVAVVYTAWTVDGFGRRSAPTSVTVVPQSNLPTDILAPSAVANLTSYATADSVRLSWDLPFDLDPLRVQIRRVDRGFRQSLGTVEGASFVDHEVAAGRTYRYELAAIDPSGNVGPGRSIDVSVDAIAAPTSFTATPNGANVDLAWTTGDTGTVQVVRSLSGPPLTALDGEFICEGGRLVRGCSDETAPADVPLFYGAFTTRDGIYSAPILTTAVRSAPTGQAGQDRDVFVGERVDLVSTDVTNPVWTANVPLVHDASGTWFLAQEPGDVTATVVGDAVEDSAVITVHPFTEDRAVVVDNPFAEGRLMNLGVVALFPRDNDVVAGLADGSVVIVDGDVETVVSLAGCSQLRHVEGDLAICGDAFQLVRGFDLRSGDEVWTAPGPQGTWRSDLSNGVFALLTLASAEDGEVAFATVSTSGYDAFATLVMLSETGVPTSLALDALGEQLAVASYNRVSVFTASGLFGPVGMTPSLVDDVTGIVDVAWSGSSLGLAIEQAPDEPGRLRTYETLGTSFVIEEDVEAPVGVHGVSASAEGWLVQGTSAQLRTLPDFSQKGPFTATSALAGAAAIVDGAVWVAASPGDGIGGDRVLVHDIDAPRLSAEPPAVFNPIDTGFSLVEALVSGDGQWAAKAFDQLAVGDASGLRFNGSIGFSSAPFELTGMVCVDDERVSYVGDVGGIPSVVHASTGATTLLPTGSWPIPTGCSAGVCHGDAAVMVCDSDVVLYDRLTGEEKDRTSIPSGMAFPMLQASGADAVLVDFGAVGEIYAAIDVTATSLTVTQAQSVPDYFGGGVVTGTQLLTPSVGLTVRYDLAETTLTGQSVQPEGADFLGFDGTLGLQTALRADAVLLSHDGGLLAADTTSKSFQLRSDAGVNMLNTGDKVVAVRTAPLGVLDDIFFAQPGESLTTVVSFAGIDDPVGVDVDCTATTGPCTVVDVDLNTQTATLSWTAGTSPGEHALTTWVGTHRWFTTATERISVELP